MNGRLAFVVALLATVALIRGIGASGGTPPPTMPPTPAPIPVVCPPGGVDADGDGVCDSGYDHTCRCGEKTACNDNALGKFNPNQRDDDCDARGNAIDGCPDTFNPALPPIDEDGDGLERECDCDDRNATIPKQNRCPFPEDRPVNNTALMWMLIVLGACAIGIVAAVILIVAGGERLQDGVFKMAEMVGAVYSGTSASIGRELEANASASASRARQGASQRPRPLDAHGKPLFAMK